MVFTGAVAYVVISAGATQAVDPDQRHHVR